MKGLILFIIVIIAVNNCYSQKEGITLLTDTLISGQVYHVIRNTKKVGLIEANDGRGNTQSIEIYSKDEISLDKLKKKKIRIKDNSNVLLISFVGADLLRKFILENKLQSIDNFPSLVDGYSLFNMKFKGIDKFKNGSITTYQLEAQKAYLFEVSRDVFYNDILYKRLNVKIKGERVRFYYLMP